MDIRLVVTKVVVRKPRGVIKNRCVSQLKVFGKGSGEEPFYRKVFPSRRRQILNVTDLPEAI
jgi:CRISPR/Cas system CMR-associated protein Cmr1 (group 7 of RAMP superfamily)